ncbi:citrate CoA-transferase [Acididesulfobacillus acetoxydans]|uniref:Citrate lyase alpha chain n=1 Tax=Acididesulfobacillus acetoxydans TaxID=1561005 RepID=A0A8S0X5V0_9FIRM|nr:citrate lyase subunit alpha [Acididesulfobacillus acetoxydans]CAA7601950.1 citrate CoA-transferase [Acididesulfobacillus acetoxydans]CEJ08206.1 Citrate lyase alpha chain [Acididesulfobacillus acetoxydans]
MKNAAGVELPEFIKGYGEVKPFAGAFAGYGQVRKVAVRLDSVQPGKTKLLESIDEAIEKVNLRDGMTISFPSHLRNGDYVINQVMEVIAAKGIRDLHLAATHIFPIHEPLVDYIKRGVVTGLSASYISPGAVAKAIMKGYLKNPAVLRSHGGRPRAIEGGELHIDVAFIGAPTADAYGNINGVQGKAACGTLSYGIADAEYADKVVVITDNLVPYPACPIEISQDYVDYVVTVDSIGDPSGIVSGTLSVTKDPVGLRIASLAAQFIDEAGYIKDGMSFQSGAGGTSLAVTAEVRKRMKEKKVVGSFAAGGVTGYIVDMMNEGLFRSVFDVQCFDLKAIASYRDNPKHQGMSGSLYGNPNTKGALVNNLDIMILGATEIDTDFNVNVITGSDGIIMGGSGGHNDTAAGSKLAIIVTNLIKGRLPVVKSKVTTVATPGETVDVLVTERGIAINPRRSDLIEKLKDSALPLVPIETLREMAERLTGVPKPIPFSDEIVAVVEYRDGSVIDVVKKPLD